MTFAPTTKGALTAMLATLLMVRVSRGISVDHRVSPAAVAAPLPAADTEAPPHSWVAQSAATAHAPLCVNSGNGELLQCRRVRFVVHADADGPVPLQVRFRGNPAEDVSLAASINGHPLTDVTESDSVGCKVSGSRSGASADGDDMTARCHRPALHRGLNTVLYQFSTEVSVRELLVLRSTPSLGNPGPMGRKGPARGGTALAATAPFETYEAEDQKCTGKVIGPAYRSYVNTTDIASEASQRRACTLSSPGDAVEITLTSPGNVAELRFSIPDGAQAALEMGLIGPGGTTNTVQIQLTSQFIWLYGASISPSSKNPSLGMAHRFYDEVTVQLPLPADASSLLPGTRIAFAFPSAVNATASTAPITIDLVDVYDVGSPLAPPSTGFVSIVDHGADPSGKTDSFLAIEDAVNAAVAQKKAVWVPEGRYLCSSGVTLPTGVTFRGAGPFHSVLVGTPWRMDSPKAVGFYANKTGSAAVQVLDLGIEGQVTGRNNSAQSQGFGGNFGAGSLFQNLRIRHTKVGGFLIGSPHQTDVHWVGVSVHNTFADGITHHKYSGTTVEGCHIRNTGDDGVALWSGSTQADANTNCTIRDNHISLQYLASGISLYGGSGHLVTGNTIADTLENGGGIHVCGDCFAALPMSGTFRILNNTVLRGGGMSFWGKSELALGGFGALNFEAQVVNMTDATVIVDDLLLLDSPFSAVQFVTIGTSHAIRGVEISNVEIRGAGAFALVLETSGSATFENMTATGLGYYGTYDCTPGAFKVGLVGDSNSGWVTPSHCGWPPASSSFQPPS